MSNEFWESDECIFYSPEAMMRTLWPFPANAETWSAIAPAGAERGNFMDVQIQRHSPCRGIHQDGAV